MFDGASPGVGFTAFPRSSRPRPNLAAGMQCRPTGYANGYTKRNQRLRLDSHSLHASDPCQKRARAMLCAYQRAGVGRVTTGGLQAKQPIAPVETPVEQIKAALCLNTENKPDPGEASLLVKPS